MVANDAIIAVHMMANRKYGRLYLGVTSQLIPRASQHREGLIPGYAKTHGLKRLVWYEHHESMIYAIDREKLLKKDKRDWKTNLIERDNPNRDDLFLGLLGQVRVPLWPGQARP